MNRQGEGAGAPDWWNELYDQPEADTHDTHGAPEGDTLDERFRSAARAVRPPGGPPAPQTGPVPGQRGRADETAPALLPPAHPGRLDELSPDTVLDGAQHGPLTVRAFSTRGDRARRRAGPRRDALLTARFGSGDSALLLVALAKGASEPVEGHLAAREACAEIAGAIGRSQPRLAEDLRGERRSSLKSGLSRLTARSLGRLRASAVDRGLDPTRYTAEVRCLVLPADPHCRLRLFFGAGGGGLFRLRAGEWQDLEPAPAPGPPPMRIGGDAGTEPLPPSGPQEGQAGRTPPFLFRASLAQPGDALLLCTEGVAGPLREQGDFGTHLAGRWAAGSPPDLDDLLRDVRVPAGSRAEDRSLAGVWEPPAV